MATHLITDPDELTDPTHITVTVATKKIKLIRADPLGPEGVTLKCVYSKLKELWKSNTTYIKYPIPMQPITDECFEMINGWDWDQTGSGNDLTPNLIRTGGWATKNASGVSQEEWGGIVTLGSLGSADQVYYQQSSGASGGVDVVNLGAVNQAVKIYGDASHGNFDYRSYFKIFTREYQKTYGVATLTDIGVSTMTYQVYRFPLANAADSVKITHNDAYVDANAPYTGMTLTWSASAVQRDIGGTMRNFHVIVDGNQGTAEQIYEFVQRSLRKATDIDAGSGTKIGKITNEALQFVGDTLKTRLDSTGGIFIDDYQVADVNRLVFVDDTGTERTFPYVAALTIQFGDNLKNDANAKYWIYFTAVPSGDYGDTDAILVQDANASAMTGDVGGLSSKQHSFDYDGNSQGGRTPGTEAPITAVAIGLGTAQFVKATATVVKSIANSVSLVAPLERNYANPA
jgi:hypothetical protein